MFTGKIISSGVEFEDYIVDFLNGLSMKAKKTGSNDGGIDIVCKAVMPVTGEVKMFYIQCKYHNRPITKAPVQEVYTGTHYYDKTASAYPVVITNNRASFETRNYARQLGVEIIADSEWAEIGCVQHYQKITSPVTHTGLLGLILTKIANDKVYLAKILEEETPTAVDDKEQLKLELISEFDEAEEHLKEAAYLQDLASKHSQRALSLQKKAIIKNLEYG